MFVGASLQTLDNQQPVCGLRPAKRICPDGKSCLVGPPGPAAILYQIPFLKILAEKQAIGISGL
jgi:hypothetical protein